MYNPRIRTAVTFVLIAVTLTVIAFAYYQCGGYTRSTNPRVIKESVTEREYSINLPGRGWYDTGLWIKSGQSVFTQAKNNPFILTIDNFRADAKLNDYNLFETVLTAYDEPTSYNEVALVKTQGKIYLYSDYPAEIYLKIFTDPASVAKFRRDKEQPDQKVQEPATESKENRSGITNDQPASSFWSWVIWIVTLIVSIVFGELVSFAFADWLNDKIKWAKGLNNLGVTLAVLFWVIVGLLLSILLMFIINRFLLWIGLYSF